MPEKIKFSDRLFQPVDSLPADLFRMFFGIAMILQFASLIKFDFIDLGILAPRVHFTYDFFGFVKPFSPALMKLVMLLMLSGAVLITFNKLYKAGILVFLLTFSYLFFLDKSYYNNHFYFIILLSIILIFYKSIPSGKPGVKSVPQWLIWLLQFQVIVVYFYGGLAKLNHDWLVNCEPVKSILEINAKSSVFSSLLRSDFTVYYLTYGGVVFDLLIGFLLLYKPALKIAIILNILFHITNFFIFNIGEGGDIGIFPLLMIFTNVLFIEPETLRKFILKISPAKTENKLKKPKRKEEIIIPRNFSANKSFVLSCLIFYAAFQLLFPFRHLLFPGNVDWTGEGQRFSWRMKVYVKSGDVLVSAKQNAQSDSVLIDWKQHINQVQYAAMRDHPEMLLQYAEHLKKISEQKGFQNIILHADAQIAMNGRPKQYILDPSLNLLSIKRNPLKHAEWIIPLNK